MTITPNDLKLLASARMTDLDDGGGHMTGTTLQDGVDNNVFPDVSSADWAWGRLQMRLVYPAVLNAGTDTLLGANAAIDIMPADGDVTAFLLGAGVHGEVRTDALARLQREQWQALGPSVTWSAADTVVAAGIGVGSVIFSETAAGVYGNPVLVLTATNTATNTWQITYAGDRGTPWSGNGKMGTPAATAPWLSSTQTVAGGLSAGATYVDLPTVLATVVPVAAAVGVEPGPAAEIGIDPALPVPAGRVAAYRSGQTLLVHHTADTTPATKVTGNTIDCGRTNIAGAAIVDATDAVFLTGFTVARSTGIVTITDSTGWTQPVRARHRIEEMVGCSRTGYPEVRGGVNSYSGNPVTAGPFTLSGGLMMYCGRPGVGEIKVYSKTGQDITLLTTFAGDGSAFNFRVDLAAGTVQYYEGAGSYGAAAFIASHSPVTLVARGTSALTTSVTAPLANPNRVMFNRALERAFPAGCKVSSLLRLGDLQASVGDDFSQAMWTGVWSDARIGDAPSAQYDQAAHPITTTNAGAITDRWALIFTTATTFRVVSESRGQVDTGSVNATCAPVNPATGAPYFSINALGWGLGWASGQVLRINTYGINAPVWVARVVMPAAPATTGDSITLAIRGDVNT